MSQKKRVGKGDSRAASPRAKRERSAVRQVTFFLICFWKLIEQHFKKWRKKEFQGQGDLLLSQLLRCLSQLPWVIFIYLYRWMGFSFTNPFSPVLVISWFRDFFVSCIDSAVNSFPSLHPHQNSMENLKLKTTGLIEVRRLNISNLQSE